MTRACLTVGLLLCSLRMAAGQSVTAPVPPRPQSPTARTQVAAAAVPTSGTAEPRPSIYDRIWQLTRLYESDSNPVVQRVIVSGRFQHEFATVDAEQGGHDEWNTRRLRVGPRVTLFRTFTVHGEVELNPQEAEPLYVRITDLYVQWSRSERLAVTVGKQGVPFTMDGSTSSKELLTIDRSNLTNNIWFSNEYVPGVSVSGHVDDWTYRVGLYSAGEMNRELGSFNAGAFALGALGYDFARQLGAKEALLTGNYVYQQPHERNSFTQPLEHIGSVNFKFSAGRWGVRTDISAATGYLEQSDLWGVMAMPFVDVTDALQIVGRYTFLESRDPNGVSLATYENRVVSGLGDRYGEWYVGANYFFYGHRLKLQAGAQFAEMGDSAADGGAYSGAALTTGIRVGW